MDPLSIGVSVLAIITAAIQSTKSLTEAIERFKSRDKTLRRLQDELKELTDILNALAGVTTVESSMLSLLKHPVDRCSQICREFEAAMKTFGDKSKSGVITWAKLEFKRGSINEFVDSLAGYKSTIAVGLGTINMHTSKLSHQVLEEYSEMVKDTMYNLEMHLVEIDEKLAQLTPETLDTTETSIDLEDERAVTKQCLRICEDARAYMESLTDQEPSLQHEKQPNSTTEAIQQQFEAQLLTRQTLHDSQKSFIKIISHLQERLVSMTVDGPGSDQERLRLREDILASKECLEVCKMASNQVSHQKIYKVGEAIADNDSDQVVVTTLADLFDVGKAQSKGRSAQLIGSMTGESLQHLTTNRYGSRFGAMTSDRTTVSPPTSEPRRASTWRTPQVSKDEQPAETTRIKPSPNEVRRRATEGDKEMKRKPRNE